MENQKQQPRNILEQILLGLSAVNQNIVDLSAEIAILRHDTESLKNAISATEGGN